MYELLEDKDWGMRWAKPPVAQTMPVAEIYIHHTAGADPADPPPSDDDAATAFRALNEYAINTKGYSAVDYSMLVHTSPAMTTTIGEARGQWLPAATKDRNQQSKAVCLFGYFHPPDPKVPWTKDASRAPFTQELEAIAEAIVWMIRQDWVVPKPIIRGHRDNPAHPGATACPGDYLYRELWQIRMLVDQMMQPGPTPPQPQPEPPAPTPPTGDDMQRLTAAIDDNGTLWIGDGITRIEAGSMEIVDNYIVLGVAGCYQFLNTSGEVIRQREHIHHVGLNTIEALGREV